mmetsp:Transcript_24054/g.52358  ORF Transcript_24054/g.52358 Transcript_24054/m.52358 type:complete len:207 (+) Transcript_24054:373-993(+)
MFSASWTFILSISSFRIACFQARLNSWYSLDSISSIARWSRDFPSTYSLISLASRSRHAMICRASSRRSSSVWLRSSRYMSHFSCDSMPFICRTSFFSLSRPIRIPAKSLESGMAALEIDAKDKGLFLPVAITSWFLASRPALRERVKGPGDFAAGRVGCGELVPLREFLGRAKGDLALTCVTLGATGFGVGEGLERLFGLTRPER